MARQIGERWIGQVLNRHYRIDSVLGKGGQATIFKGVDLLIQETIAIKQFHQRGDEKSLERFKREARHQMKLSHPNIVGTRAIIEEDDEYFIVMEYVDGTDLGHLLSVSEELPRLPLDQIHSIFVEVLDALGYAHSHGVIHRDIKPSNVMLTQDYRVKLADFGMARQLHDQQLTVAGQVLGTPAYTAPEILQGASTLDPRCDIYSAGVALYETLCGTTPFLNEGEVLSPFELLGRHMFMEPEAPTSRGIPISEDLDQVVMKSIAKDPELRFASCAAFKDALVEALSEHTSVWNAPVVSADKRNNHDTTIVLRPDFSEGVPRVPQNDVSWQATEHQVDAIPRFLQNQTVVEQPIPIDEDEQHPTVVIEGAQGADLRFTDGGEIRYGRKRRRSPIPIAFVLIVGVFVLGLGLWFLARKQHMTPSLPDARQARRQTTNRAKTGGVYPQQVPNVPMVFIPGGTFLQGLNRGSPTGGFSPQRRVYLAGFWIDQFEVTVRQYRTCVSAGECTEPQGVPLSTLPGERPVSGVTWEQADIFCKWAGKKLPTEAQWEKAARGTDGRTYPWGDKPPACSYANHCNCSANPQLVGRTIRSLGKSKYGAYDMSGNVWEWTRDCFSLRAYSLTKRTNPFYNRSNCSSRVLRGGSYRCKRDWGLYSYTRLGAYFKSNDSDFGFRCAWRSRR